MSVNMVNHEEINSVMSLIADVIKDMDRNGIYQWDEIYPDRNVMLGDISSRSLYSTRIDTRIVGIICVNETQLPEYSSISWNDDKGCPLIVHRLCVHPVFQGQGLAKLLMHFAEDYARRNGYSSIRLDAFIKNGKATGLYDSLGYDCQGTVRFRKGDFFCYEKSFATGTFSSA